jgi:hypothetical protein
MPSGAVRLFIGSLFLFGAWLVAAEGWPPLTIELQQA